ncbi:fructose-specific PTS transporter subunit EIIC [Paracidovorax citrulli]|uniref:protein-N(pi)-phosphohistidine--D-fructose phosphotransferase n=2 Tax=Paracidovorax citrulli TaxID=80869 RepID=A1TV02_PARC0|nr:fructose-specific PTS transporter subunit EIIC [Paracidovorax citrulli]ABM34790.1 PTS system D-fructose-specific IIB component (F1P-forming), Frc family / PTS system D-fructose-specific IIC component (F1P-forming), Frc family [Paracidovorax citrulli AAC00-1]ATG96638.1 PTS fructose transporter subunit EIIBC [Paracidovorax citrulli]PVY64238.1 PTS system D-fructose-specific IIB component (F1P-forming) (Frc family) /PTS system D-fructose-specific IIC component (F1P-forming) (Frc family) [Paracido
MAQLIAIAASQAGPAHSFMVAEALRAAAESLGHRIAVSVHSSLGTQGGFSDGELAGAAAAIIAADMPVDRQDLLGTAAAPVHEAAPQEVLADAERVVRAALARAGGAPARVAASLPPAAPAAASPATAAPQDGPLRIVAITSCPTGVAHTFMAAEALEQGARALGHTIKVETQGSVGAQNALTAGEIAEADLVVIAADTQVNRDRFAGKRLYATSTKAAIHDAAAVFAQARAQAQAWGASASPAPAAGGSAAALATAGKRESSGAYKHLMTGVSFMLPFVVAGGLLIALAFALGGIYVYDDAHKGTFGWVLFQVGAKAGFALMLPALAGYIAYSIADRPGIAPGMIGGMLAGTVGAGFLGAIAAGFIAGYAVHWLNRFIRLPRGLDGLKPVLILPLLGAAIVGVLMMMVIGAPMAAVMGALTDWLKGLQTGSAVLLGVILGAMMAFDMGGPVNKAAYVFSTTLIASGVANPMAAAMAAGMTPPLGIALACWLFKNRFTAEEREASKASAVLGLAFITEGAIPFVARDPLRVIPACVLGSAVAGGLSMAWNIGLQAPHGGVFVLAIPNAVNHVVLYAAAILAGTVVTALALGLFKKKLQPSAR